MFKIALKSTLAKKLRLVSTALSVILGVAFLAGTLVFTDTIKRTFDDLFADVFAGTDSYVRSESTVDLGMGNEQRGRIPESVIDTVRRRARGERRAGDRAGLRPTRRHRWKGDRQSRAGRADVRHELRVRADEPVAAHRREPATGTGRAADRQGQRRQGWLRDRRHRHGAHPNRSARVPARRHGPVRHGRLARWRKCLRLRPGDGPGRCCSAAPARSTP